MESLPAIYLIIQLLCVIGVFAFLAYASEYIVNKVKSSPGFKNSKFLNPMEYFPQEKILSLKQLYYLIMILVFIVISLYIISYIARLSLYLLNNSKAFLILQ